MLAVNPVLDIKYEKRCSKCIEYHAKKYGSLGCFFKVLTNCYCPQIEKSERCNKEVNWF